jgi:hypothetical protein
LLQKNKTIIIMATAIQYLSRANLMLAGAMVGIKFKINTSGVKS